MTGYNLQLHLRYSSSILKYRNRNNIFSRTKTFLRYLWVLQVLTPRMSQIFLGKIISFNIKRCLAWTRLWISRTFQDLTKKSSTFKWPKQNSRTFNRTSKIQDLFKIVRTCLHLYSRPSIKSVPVSTFNIKSMSRLWETTTFTFVKISNNNMAWSRK